MILHSTRELTVVREGKKQKGERSNKVHQNTNFEAWICGGVHRGLRRRKESRI